MRVGVQSTRLMGNVLHLWIVGSRVLRSGGRRLSSVSGAEPRCRFAVLLRRARAAGNTLHHTCASSGHVSWRGQSARRVSRVGTRGNLSLASSAMAGDTAEIPPEGSLIPFLGGERQTWVAPYPNLRQWTVARTRYRKGGLLFPHPRVGYGLNARAMHSRRSAQSQPDVV